MKFIKFKKVCMAMVIIVAVVCAFISFFEKEYIVGILSCLTVVVPAIIWFSDSEENKSRDNRINLQDEILGQAVNDLNKKADADQGYY